MAANTEVIGLWLPRRCWGRRLWRGVDRRGRRQGIREGEGKEGILHTRVKGGLWRLVGNEWRNGWATAACWDISRHSGFGITRWRPGDSRPRMRNEHYTRGGY